MADEDLVDTEADEPSVVSKDVQPASREDLPPADSTPHTDNPEGYQFLRDVRLCVSAELGSTQMTVREILALQEGSVVELEKLAGEMIDVRVQGNYLGKGEVMVIADLLGVRLTEVGPRDVEGIMQEKENAADHPDTD